MFIPFVFSIPYSKASENTVDTLNHLEGCFEVIYKFTETKLHDFYLDNNLEIIEKEILPNGDIKFQHYGIFGGEKVRHWGETWSLKESGNWNQEVVGPNGVLRYTCEAPFIFNQWRCATEHAGKPLRDRNRKDYVDLDRENTLQITPNGWVHMQRNFKKTKTGETVSAEIGWVEYKKLEPSKCNI